jgi:hypothetical protein
MASNDPFACWSIVLKILDVTDDEWIVTNLGAGPLENLLALHPDETIERLKSEIPNNPKLKNALMHTWQNMIPDEHWNEIQRLK